MKQLRSPRGGQSLRLTGIPQRCGADGGPGEGSRDAALRERRAGRPLATGPSGLESEPKAPGKAWREDARQTLGLSTGIADITACTIGLPTGLASAPKAPGKAWREDARRTLGLSTGTAEIAASTTHRHRWNYPPVLQVLPPEHQTHAQAYHATFPDQDSRVKPDRNTTNQVSKFTL
ncbi:hypothetical protein AAGR22_02820 [Erwinia sp. HDF1-3R]|uniref:hypothetical protein n=1 Tax=Erwinia sp. HDF1-3R TaxID=3141543 RepID=UPI0031F519CF